ncbi:MAG: hypothetical protein E7597_04645 [Ruminococcaceae bacterium]|nr:hypothetical protein [Oscillospiraceae bacterium]
MKKIFVFLVILLLLTSFAACKEAEKVVDDANSQLSKVESDIESGASRVESNLESNISELRSDTESEMSKVESRMKDIFDNSKDR